MRNVLKSLICIKDSLKIQPVGKSLIQNHLVDIPPGRERGDFIFNDDTFIVYYGHISWRESKMGDTLHTHRRKDLLQKNKQIMLNFTINTKNGNKLGCFLSSTY